MLDIKFVRTNPDAVKENIKKKFQDEKIELADASAGFDTFQCFHENIFLFRVCLTLL